MPDKDWLYLSATLQVQGLRSVSFKYINEVQCMQHAKVSALIHGYAAYGTLHYGADLKQMYKLDFR